MSLRGPQTTYYYSIVITITTKVNSGNLKLVFVVQYLGYCYCQLIKYYYCLQLVSRISSIDAFRQQSMVNCILDWAIVMEAAKFITAVVT